MKRFLSLAFLSVLLATSASATVITYVATLNGANENPVNPSLGVGTATLVIDTAANSASLSVTFSGLASPSTAAHIHCCLAPPTNAGVTVGSNGFPGNVTAGSFSANYDLLDSTIYSSTFLSNNGGSAAGAMAALLTGLAGGQTYYNIHTSGSPGGEVRGYFAVPEPGAALLLAAAGALAARRRAARR